MKAAIVDREYEFCVPDNEVVVILECGHRERFFVTGLSDVEYIRRARILKKI